MCWRRRGITNCDHAVQSARSVRERALPERVRDVFRCRQVCTCDLIDVVAASVLAPMFFFASIERAMRPFCGGLGGAFSADQRVRRCGADFALTRKPTTDGHCSLPRSWLLVAAVKRPESRLGGRRRGLPVPVRTPCTSSGRLATITVGKVKAYAQWLSLWSGMVTPRELKGNLTDAMEGCYFTEETVGHDSYYTSGSVP